MKKIFVAINLHEIESDNLVVKCQERVSKKQKNMLVSTQEIQIFKNCILSDKSNISSYSLNYDDTIIYFSSTFAKQLVETWMLFYPEDVY